MDAATLLKLGVVISIFLIVFAIGLKAELGTGLRFLEQPGQTAKAMTAMFVLFPAFALIVHFLLPLKVPIPATLLALAVSPIPPILPNKEVKAGGRFDYAIALQVVASVFSIAAAAVIIPLVGRIVGEDLVFAGEAMALNIVKTVGVPLLAGMLVRRFLPDLAMKLMGPAARIGNVLLIAVALVLLVAMAPDIWGVMGQGTLFAVVAMVLFGLAAGHLLGGPDEGNRTALAVAVAGRHPGVAIALGAAVRPEAAREVVATVLLYLLASVILTIPYTRWRNRKTAEPAG
jgi:BASS family bile acid:Na+ symporter